MKRIFFIFSFFLFFLTIYAQLEDVDDIELLPHEPVSYKLKLQRFRYPKPIIEGNDTMWCYLLPELPLFYCQKVKN